MIDRIGSDLKIVDNERSTATLPSEGDIDGVFSRRERGDNKKIDVVLLSSYCVL
jgi:hypothetical protein